MAIETQTRAPGQVTQSGGEVDWTNINNTLTYPAGFAAGSINSSPSIDTTQYLVWTNFGFSFDPLSTLEGIEIEYGLVHANTTIAFSVSANIRLNDSSTSTVSTSSTASPSGTNVSKTAGGVGSFLSGLSTKDIFNPTFGFRQQCRLVTGLGTVQFRHYGMEMTIYYSPPTGTVLSSSARPVRIGNSPIRAIQSSSGAYRPGFDVASNYNTRSSSKLLIGGVPISVYESSSGSRALAVYDVDGSLDGALSLSSNSFVYQGTRFSYLENGTHRVMHATLGGERSVDTTTYSIWQGIPIATNAFGDLVCKKLSGTVTQTRRFSLGGTPLTAVLVGDDWAIAVSDV
tara:strand:- start:23944 stop:24972 length:1029 start_codon:yes stop_codon:yes gene_type:complete